MRRSRDPRMLLGLLIGTAWAMAPVSSSGFGVVAGMMYETVQHRQRIDGGRSDRQRPEQVSAAGWRRIVTIVEADAYAVRVPAEGPGASTLEAHNRAHGLRAGFTRSGLGVLPARESETGWEWAMRLERFGYEGSLASVEEVTPVAEGNRVEYRRVALTEWYVNERAGLQHGFTVPERPSNRRELASPLVLDLRADGLEIRQGVGKDSILLVGDDDAGILLYQGLIAWDDEGTYLPAKMRATAEGIRIEVDDRGAAYPLTIDPYIQRAVLRASDAQSIDFFGGSVAISGDTAIVAAGGEDGGSGDPLPGAGAAYVFERNQGGTGNWGEVKKLTASDAQAHDAFGSSVAISGDTAIVGARAKDGGPLTDAGAAYVFARNQGGANNWGEVKKITASDAEAYDRFGGSVAISGDAIVVGARSEAGGPGSQLAGAGAAYVFERNQGGAGNWGQVAKLSASDAQPGDSFGDSVTISGDTAIVGAPGEDGGAGDPSINAGAAYAYRRNQGGAGNWGQVAKLTSSDAQSNDIFGDSVAISGAAAIVGAPGEDGGGGDPLNGAGAAYAFGRDQGGANNWGEIKKLTATNAQAAAFLGREVAISGDAAIVGATGFRNPPPIGAAYVFERDLGGVDNWGEVQKLVASDAQAFDQFGVSVSISGDTAAVGASGEGGGAGDPLSAAGAAYVYDADPSVTWAFVLDGFGALYALGSDVVPVQPPPPYLFSDIARDMELWGDGAYVLDGFGGVHTAGGLPPLFPAAPSFGMDIAKDLEMLFSGGGYVLDGYGGVHTVGGAPVLNPPTPYFGFDVARDLEIGGGGYYVLDGFGGLHRGAGATLIAPGPPYFGFDIARDLELAPGGGAYALDGFGGVHPLGSAPALAPTTPYFGFDVARDLELVPGGPGYHVLDGFGGLHAGGGAAAILPPPPYFGFDAVRDLELR